MQKSIDLSGYFYKKTREEMIEGDGANNLFAEIFNIFREYGSVEIINNFTFNNNAGRCVIFKYRNGNRLIMQLAFGGISGVTYGNYTFATAICGSAHPDNLQYSGSTCYNYTNVVFNGASTYIPPSSVIISISDISLLMKICYIFVGSAATEPYVVNFFTGYSAKHFETGERAFLINDRLPGVPDSTVDLNGGIAIPRPSTLLAPQSDVVYSLPIIIPDGDNAGFTGYFTEGYYATSNIHQYPIGTTVSIDGKRYTVSGTRRLTLLEDD